MTALQTVLELPEFFRQAEMIMTDAERAALVDRIAANPEAGISPGGGRRKVRIPREDGGNSGGYRTVNVFGGTHMPIYLLTVFAKNERDNLTKTEQAAAVALAKALAQFMETGDSAYKSMIQRLNEALDHANGEKTGAVVREVEVPTVDVAAIRASTGVSQSDFARSIGVAKGNAAQLGTWPSPFHRPRPSVARDDRKATVIGQRVA